VKVTAKKAYCQASEKIKASFYLRASAGKKNRRFLFLSFFVHGLSPAPLAVLFEFDFAHHKLLVFA